jgi:hypothetical protein
MKNIFIEINSTFEKQLIVRGSNGVTLIEGTGRLLENNMESRDFCIEKNTNITIDSFDLYTDKVILTCTKNKKQYSVSVSYEFILNNCKIENRDKNKIIEATYVVSSIKNVIDLNTVIYTMIYVITFICGLLLGRT